MKTIGLIGGMSWKSSLEYYRLINESVNKKLGSWHSAKIIIYSVDFEEIDLEHRTKKWKKSDKIIFDAATTLEASGADFIVIGANTAHVLADKIQKKITIPLIHIADATAQKIKSKKIKNVGLLGTKYTMQENFYKDRLEKKYDLRVIVPEEKEMDLVNSEINNVILGKKNHHAKQTIIKIMNMLQEKGADAIIMGCTELPLIIQQKDVNIPIFNTLDIHVEAIVEYSLK